MRILLFNEIKKEIPNSSALGEFNTVISYKEEFAGKTNTFKL